MRPTPLYAVTVLQMTPLGLMTFAQVAAYPGRALAWVAEDLQQPASPAEHQELLARLQDAKTAAHPQAPSHTAAQMGAGKDLL